MRAIVRSFSDHFYALWDESSHTNASATNHAFNKKLPLCKSKCGDKYKAPPVGFEKENS